MKIAIFPRRVRLSCFLRSCLPVVNRSTAPTPPLATRLLLGCLAVVGLFCGGGTSTADDVSFTEEIAPLLASHCGGCHVRARKGEFRVRNYSELLASGRVVAGDPAGSPLVSMIEAGEMPPRSSVPKADLEMLKAWVASGAEFDGEERDASLLALAKAAPKKKGRSSGSGGGGGDGGYGESYGADYGEEDEYEDDEGGYGDDYEDDYGDGYGTSSGRGGIGSGGALSQLPASVSGIPRAVILAGTASEDDVSTGPILAEDAEEAFAAGNLPLALQLYFAHMVAEYEQASDAFSAVRYSARLRRPVWQMRWGVSLMVRGDESIEEYAPIGSGSTGTRLASRGGGGGGYGDDYGEDYGDDYGEEDYSEEDYGEDYGDDYGDDGGGMAATPAPEEEVAVQAEYSTLGEEAGERLENVLGLVAKQVAEGFRERFRAGRFGEALNKIEPQSSVTISGDWFEPAEMPMWIPGVVYLGEGHHRETMEKAKASGVELLLHFDVAVVQDREGQVKNTSVCRIVHAASGRTVVVSKPMENLEAQKQAQFERATESEFVQQQLQKLFDVLDETVSVAPMPELTADQARQRVGQIISGGSGLRALAEVRLFQSQKLLKQDEVEAAFEIIAGDDGLVMLHGAEEDRLRVARQWATKDN